ncbi:MAG: ABC transporter substrate-binding protein [Lachnospiraceae bacterium]
MKRTISIILTILMISTSLLGCSSGDEKKETIKENKTITNSGKTDLVLAKEADATTLDPQAGWDGNSLVVMRQLFNGLVKLDENLKPVPDLAESYEYLSDTQIQFKLRKGVKFHNGEEMKASDVKYSIERAMSSAKVKSFTANIKEVKIVDDYTVEIETDIAYAPLLYNLCHTACYIVPSR